MMHSGVLVKVGTSSGSDFSKRCVWQNLGLAVRAFAEVLEARRQDGGSAAAPDCVLVVAGGYDKRLAENREHFLEVQQLVADLRLQEQARPPSSLRMPLWCAMPKATCCTTASLRRGRRAILP